MVVDKVVGDANIVEPQAGKFGHETVVLGIQPSLDEIDQLHSALFFGAGLEQLFFARPNRPARQLPLDDGESLLDFSLVHAGAISPEKKLGHIRGHRILPLELANKVLANEVSLECLCSDLIQCVELHVSFLQ